MRKEYFKSLMPLIKDLGLISGIGIGILTIILLVTTVINWFISYEPLIQNIQENFVALAGYVIMLICAFILFLPAEIILIYICKKITSKKWQIFWVAFLIPFSNMIYCLIEYFTTYPIDDPTYHPILYSEWLGGYMLFFVLPSYLVVTSCIPKNKLNYKTSILKTVGLMMLFGVILIQLTYWILHTF